MSYRGGYVASWGSNTTNGTGSGRPGGWGRGPPPWARYTPCGYCDTKCVYYAIETIFIVGVLANAIVIARVVMDKQLRNSTFVAIAALAFADMFFLSVNIIVSYETVILTVTCDYPAQIIGTPYYIIKSITWFGANGHVALLAILRYVSLNYPLKANAYLTTKRVLVFSAIVWVLGAILMISLTCVIIFTDMVAGLSQEFLLALWTIVYLMPLIITATLHVVKVYRVRRSTRNTATDSTKKYLRIMSKMVILVIVCAAILPFPRLLDKILRTYDRNIYGSKELKNHIGGISNVLFLVNHCINPVIYGFVSKPFRNSLKRMFACIDGSKEDSIVTSDTPVPSRRREMSLQSLGGKSGHSIDSFDM